MTKTTKPAKCGTTTATRNFTLTAKRAKSIDRLAWQFEMSPKRLIARIIELGILTIDNEMSQGCETLRENLIEDFNCTKQMDSMTFDRIAEIVELTGKDCQEVLYEKWEAKRRERDLATKARNLVPFHYPPRFAI